jgi:hypothetical protein
MTQGGRVYVIATVVLVLLLLGTTALAVAAQTPELGRGVLLAAPVFSIGVFAGALTGEATRGLPAGRVRRAGLRVRRTSRSRRRPGAVPACCCRRSGPRHE